jgi:preprotein translocase subunit SecG
MQLIVLVIHLVVCIALIGLVLLQRSEGGALGMGGGGGGSLMSGRGAADALARMTQFAGGFFLVTSLSLTLIAGSASTGNGRSVLDMIQGQGTAPVTTTTTAPATQPATPAVPDPTQSSAPQAATTQLASATVQPAAQPPAPATVAPSPVSASERAQPLNTRPTTSASIPASATQRPAATTAATTVRPPAAAPTRTAAATTQRPATTPANAAGQPTQRLILPNTSGSQTGAAFTLPAEALNPESGNADGGVAAVRRERAGPDQ